MSTNPRIYVANLAAYNAGLLQGAWIDATDDADLIQDQINEMLAYSPVAGAEEYAIHDFEGFGDYKVNEFDSIRYIQEIACFISEFPEFGSQLISYFGSLEEARKIAEENYCGCYKSVSDYAEEVTEQTASIPPHIAPYIDYHAMAKDWELGGDILLIETSFENTHIFHNH